MVKEIDKYRARFFQICGFACMTPLSKIFLEVINIELADLTLKFFLYLLVSAFLFCFGIILNIKGMETLEERKHQWIQ